MIRFKVGGKFQQKEEEEEEEEEGSSPKYFYESGNTKSDFGVLV